MLSFLTTLLTALLALTMVTTAFPTAIDTDTASALVPTKPYILVDLFYDSNCNGKPTYGHIEADTCYDFSAGVKSLRVVGVVGDVKYNALNVYSAELCKSGPVLQPVLSDACSEVVAYKAIKLSIDTPKN